MRQASRCRMQCVRNAQCPCCESRESETIQHTLFECKASEKVREVFHSRLYSARPLARQLTGEYRCRLVMGDKLPPGEKSVVPGPLSYCYFEAPVGIPTEQAEGS